MTKSEFERTMRYLDAEGPEAGLHKAFKEIVAQRIANAGAMAKSLLSRDSTWKHKTFFELCVEFGPELDFITLSELHNALGGFEDPTRDAELRDKIVADVRARGLGHLLTEPRSLLGPASLPICPN